MSVLAFTQAPPPSLPMRFLQTAMAWGIFAGLWILCQGDTVLASRWAPPTLVLVHVLALGVLGNAMLGSLVQFLPVAVNSPFPGLHWVPWLHALFNLGLGLLLTTLADSRPLLAWPAGALLGGSLAVYASLALGAVLHGQGMHVVRDGIAMAIAALLVTLALGLWLLAARTGWVVPAPAGWVDLHAAFGVIGWITGLLAAVASITLPMLQGTRAVPVATLRAWQLAWLLALSMATAAKAGVLPEAPLRIAAWPLAVFASAVLLLQARAPYRRGASLRRFWQAGCTALLGACIVAAWDGNVIRMGMLVLGIGLPLLVVGMALEISAFLAWIALRQRIPRGMRVPGVGTLSTDMAKRRAWVGHLLAGVLLGIATFEPAATRVAGALLVLAYGLTLYVLWRCWRQAAHWHPQPIPRMPRC